MRIRIGSSTIPSLLLALSACGGAPTSDPGVLAVDSAGFRVAVPAGWHALVTERSDWRDGQTVAVLSTQPLNPQCEASDVPRECRTPLITLDSGALLIWWKSTNCAGTACMPPAGDPALVGGREATRVQGTNVCTGLAATSEAAFIVAVTPQRLDAIVVCQRNAPASVNTAVADLLEHVDWRTP
jgi:hypothetical protein